MRIKDEGYIYLLALQLISVHRRARPCITPIRLPPKYYYYVKRENRAILMKKKKKKNTAFYTFFDLSFCATKNVISLLCNSFTTQFLFLLFSRKTFLCNKRRLREVSTDARDKFANIAGRSAMPDGYPTERPPLYHRPPLNFTEAKYALSISALSAVREARL